MTALKKPIYFALLLSVLLLVYELSALAIAYDKLPQQFAPYMGHTPEELGLSKERQQLLIRIQDPGFYAHSGIEWPSPLTSTTITQSLVKKLFFKKFTKGFKKIEQSLIARFVVTPNIDKNTQLVAFISTAYFGEKHGQQLFGFDQGAKAWFNKPLSELNDQQYVILVAMLPGPNRLKPNSVASKQRIRRIQRLLKGECDYHHISQINLEQCQ